MVLAVCNENGEVLDRVSIPTETPEITMPKMIAYFKEQQVEALGIGFFGPVILNEQSPKYGCVGNTPKLAWKWYPVLDEFKKALQIPVGFDTDVNAAALGEATWGHHKGLKEQHLYHSWNRNWSRSYCRWKDASWNAASRRRSYFSSTSSK